ncbi:T9SS type A sorting domain-containing protein [Nonlabens xiamenensis]|uniref:T9SS type A sorting domain-containing protein n=1 Tax=Nonlabens xiamenensis TaxID=2341043 RepID=UPI000F609E6C|nr:T9SS type A sorting domain-containing protein [Nonlabens xiamenensis]
MKKILLLLHLFSLGYMIAQIPSGADAVYKFTGGSLVNTISPGIGDLQPRANGHLFTSDRDGNPNAALRNRQETFDGISLNATASQPINNLTFSFWYLFENANVGTNTEAVMQLFDNQGHGVRINKISSTQMDVEIQTATTSHTVQFSDSRFAQTQWQHIAVVVARRTGNYAVNMIVNGQSISSTNVNTLSNNANILDSAADFVLSPVISQFGLRSATDDIYLYSRELSLADITGLYNEPGIVPLTKVYASTTGSGSFSGDSWANSTTLGAALSMVTQNGEIWVKSGTYKPTSGTNRMVPLDVDKSVSLYGGFAGNETNINQRVLGANPTILDGDLMGNDDNRIIDGNVTYNDNSVTIVEIGASNVNMDGFTITSAYASDATAGTRTGYGALYIDNNVKNFTLKNMLFTRNVARGGGAGIYYAPLNQNSASLRIENSVFKDNFSRIGTGIYLETRANTNMDVKIINSLFYDNATGDMASGQGVGASSALIRATEVNNSINVDLVHCAFIDNEERSTGSSTFVYGRQNVNAGPVTCRIFNSIFDTNTNANSTEPSPISPANATPVSTLVRNILTSTSTATAGGNQLLITVGQPTYVDETNDNFRFASNSLGIDDGNANNTTGFNITEDLDGNTRIVGNEVDLGPYEFGATASLIDVGHEKIAIYPNPATTLISVTSDVAFAKATIYNLQGQIVKETTTSDITIAELNSGVYLLEIITASGFRDVLKFVKK